MSSYFTNSYLGELQSEHDHYSTGQQNRIGGCDPLRQLSHHYGPDASGADVHADAASVSATYPRFPPYDRLDIRPITSQQSQYGFGSPCDPLEDNGCATHVSPVPTPLQQQQQPQQQVNGLHEQQQQQQQQQDRPHYTSCKLQPVSQASPVAAASPPEDSTRGYQTPQPGLQQQPQQTAQTGQSGNAMPIYKWMRETNCEYIHKSFLMIFIAARTC
ncbi:PREDICTED: homeotic protein antennapedia-like [Priapulus caudatus]|uniref:Homeotic protein antennapedia-like n=1 Tax=Priapulus caudatus TaxID=37621 RepID=A0ABM1F8S1_PRICU|nr:PREDICTED: homeotic protein antennapedia-like [Priapulus caudatus]